MREGNLLNTDWFMLFFIVVIGIFAASLCLTELGYKYKKVKKLRRSMTCLFKMLFWINMFWLLQIFVVSLKGIAYRDWSYLLIFLIVCAIVCYYFMEGIEVCMVYTYLPIYVCSSLCIFDKFGYTEQIAKLVSVFLLSSFVISMEL